MALLTQTEYARHRKERGLDGGTGPAVRKAVETNRIAYEPGKGNLIDPDKADKAWFENTEPRPPRAEGIGKPGRKKGTKNGEGEDYNESRSKREFYESELSRLKFEEKSGKLIPADSVRKVAYEIARIIRAGHEDIVSQLAPDLASETDIGAVERILKARLNKLDADFAARIKRLDEQFAETGEDEA